MSLDRDALRDAVARHGRVARVVVAEARGSVPREVGAAMLVWRDTESSGGQAGTIGGGALEYEAAAEARRRLDRAEGPALARRPLGPALGQCCGGAVTLLTEIFDAATLAPLLAATDRGEAVWARPVAPGTDPDAPPLAVARLLARARRGGARPAPALVAGWMVEPAMHATHRLWLHGAGHVGRAIVAVTAPLPGWAITWVDTAPERFPDDQPQGVDILAAADPARAVVHAPRDAHHLILTYSHALDLALCDAVLRRGFASAGLIGSATKWARFRKRLTAMGHGAAEIDRIACPIGDPALGKHPQAIAIGCAAALLRAADRATSAPAATSRTAP